MSKKRLRHRRFPEDYSKFLKKPSLKEPRNHNKIIFASATKIGENTTNALTAIFQTKFTFLSIKLNTYTKEIKLILINSIYWSSLLYKSQEDAPDQRILKDLLSPNRNDTQTFDLLRWMFFIPYGNWKTLFFLKVCRNFVIFLIAIFLFALNRIPNIPNTPFP